MCLYFSVWSANLSSNSFSLNPSLSIASCKASFLSFKTSLGSSGEEKSRSSPATFFSSPSFFDNSMCTVWAMGSLLKNTIHIRVYQTLFFSTIFSYKVFSSEALSLLKSTDKSVSTSLKRFSKKSFASQGRLFTNRSSSSKRKTLFSNSSHCAKST